MMGNGFACLLAFEPWFAVDMIEEKNIMSLFLSLCFFGPEFSVYQYPVHYPIV